MDQKSWIWKKKSTEKALVSDKAMNSFNINADDAAEVQGLLTEKGELARDLGILNEKLSTALSDCSAKDNFAKKQVKIAQEAIAGWEKAEAEAMSLKKDLDKAMQQKAASEERSSLLDASLKDCMHQLHLVREDQQRRIQSAVLKALDEFDKTRSALEQKLDEAGKQIVRLDSENSQLKRALAGKERIIQELSEYQDRVEADFTAVKLRVDSADKENGSLRYEVRVLEKELEIRSEEAEFNRRAADVAQKKNKECVQRISNLESECQKLRLLVRKRLPGPAALMRMRNEVTLLGRDHGESRRRRSNASMDFPANVAADTSDKKIGILAEHLSSMEEENQSLSYALDKKTTASRLQGEVEQSLNGQTATEQVKYSRFLQERSVATLSDLGSDDKASCAESWSSPLEPELENLKSEKQFDTPSRGNMSVLEMHLMDDFVEMEKLAVVSVNNSAGSPRHSSEERIAILRASESSHQQDSFPAVHLKTAAVPSEPLISQPEHTPTKQAPRQLDDLLEIFLKHCQEQHRSPHEVLDDVRTALSHHSLNAALTACKESANRDPFQMPNDLVNLDIYDRGSNNSVLSTTINSQRCRSNMHMALHKVIELLERITTLSQRKAAAESLPGKDAKFLPSKNLQTTTGYIVQVFQWKAEELSNILQQSVQACKDLLNGDGDIDHFAVLVASTLDWVLNHCFSMQDVSSIEDTFRSHLDLDDFTSESEVDIGSANHSAESNKLHSGKELLDSPIPQLRQTAKEISNQNENKEMGKENLKRRSCDDQKMQIKSMTTDEVLDTRKPGKNQLETEWEITAASEKLAECQETIANLGKQLKALASPNAAALFNKIISTTTDPAVTSTPSCHRSVGQRLSLLDNMLAEDDSQTSASTKNTHDFSNGNSVPAAGTDAATESLSTLADPANQDTGSNAVDSKAIVPVKNKKTGSKGFLRKLFKWHKKGNSKKTPPFS